MNLIIDIGNSRSKLVAFSDGDVADESTSEGHALGHLAAFSARHGFEAAIVSTVVGLPSDAEAALAALPCPVVHFTPETPVPIVNRYHTPATLGRDRLAAAVWAAQARPDSPSLVIDMGSCITCDLVCDRAFVGGNITPGLHARLRAIDEFFPCLPHVDDSGDLPELGYDTPTAIRSGIIRGIVYEIQGYISHYRNRHPTLHVFATGGDSHILQPAQDTITIDPYIVARGLNAILRHNLHSL